MTTTSSRRCAAKRRDGQQCRQPAMQGQSVCRMHGGASPQAKRKAAERIAQAEAQQTASEVYLRHADQMPENPLEALKQLTRRQWAVYSDLYGRLAASPERFAELMPAVVGTGEKLAALLTGWLRADPPTDSDIRTVQDLLITLNLHPDEPDWQPSPRPALPPAPQNEVEPVREPPDAVERQDGHGSASTGIDPRTGRPWKTDSSAADEVEAEVLKRSPWRKVTLDDGREFEVG